MMTLRYFVGYRFGIGYITWGRMMGWIMNLEQTGYLGWVVTNIGNSGLLLTTTLLLDGFFFFALSHFFFLKLFPFS